MYTLPLHSLTLFASLGTFPLWVLTADDYLNMWDACVYQNDLFQIKDQWCNIWTYEDVDDLAFSEDLDFYWQKGYGYEIDWTIAVNLFNDITTKTMTALMKMKNFQTQCPDWIDHVQGADCDTMIQNAKYQNTATFRFAHAETVVPALAWLGLYYTPPSLMMASTPKADRDSRQWKTTVLSPYAANLNFLTYVCAADANEPYSYALLKVLHNEKEVPLPYCNGVYCEFSAFMSHYHDQLGLDFNTMCNQ
jgi:multiple inositol-polyphosphate phosphatase/2,3-bisphosphoglycerate 3-phosphatase